MCVFLGALVFGYLAALKNFGVFFAFIYRAIKIPLWTVKVDFVGKKQHDKKIKKIKQLCRVWPIITVWLRQMFSKTEVTLIHIDMREFKLCTCMTLTKVSGYFLNTDWKAEAGRRNMVDLTAAQADTVL